MSTLLDTDTLCNDPENHHGCLFLVEGMLVDDMSHALALAEKWAEEERRTVTVLYGCGAHCYRMHPSIALPLTSGRRP